MRTKPYPSDLTDARWGILKPLLPPASKLGRPRETDLRDILDAIYYRNRNGCTWRALPHAFSARRGGKRIKGRKRHIAGGPWTASSGGDGRCSSPRDPRAWHTSPMRQRGECRGSLAGASGGSEAACALGSGGSVPTGGWRFVVSLLDKRRRL